MKNIPIHTDKYNTDEVIEDLRSKLEAGLAWLSKSYPAARVGKRKVPTGKNDKTIIQTYPQVYMQD